MSLKSMTRKVTARAGRQILTVREQSPVFLVAVGVVGIATSTVLACQATLKLSDILEQGEKNLEKVDAAKENFDEEEIKKASFGVKLKVAIDVVNLYAPSAVLFAVSASMIVGSHVILKKRNAGLAAAYAVVDKSFKEYRSRVVADQGEEKDFEYRHGVVDREIVVDGKDGPETKVVSGLDQEAIENEDPELNYRRVFRGPDWDEHGDPVPGTGNPNWSPVGNNNQYFLNMIQSQVNDLLTLQGHVFLNQVYDLLGFEPTAAGQIVGWVANPEEGEGDGRITFGVWNNGVYEGKKWLNGDKEAFLLDFNVDGPILHRLKKV